MKTKTFNIFIGSIIASCLVMVFGIAASNSDSVSSHQFKIELAEASVKSDAGTYYSSIDSSLTGTDLLDALHTLNSSKRRGTIGYAGMRQFAAKSDIDPDGSGKIVGFYDNKLVGPTWDSGKTWNREHVWPNVRGGSLVEADAHMVRPTATSTNSDRGSKGYGTESYDPGKYVEYYRGAAARIIFYAAIAETSLSIVDFPFNYDGVSNGNNGYPTKSMGSLSDMLKWNLQYLPSNTSFTGANDLARRVEINRNEVIQNDSSGQGNRNPFIDHPEYACKIWGNTNEKTKAICGMSSSSTVTLDKSTASVNVGEIVTIKATSSLNDNITWTTSNDNVSLSNTTTASGNSIDVTGLSVGTTILTATNEDNASAQCTITITEQSKLISINYSEVNLEVGQSIDLIAATNDNSDITWEFEDIGYKILNFQDTTSKSGEIFTIKGLKDGSTTITITSTNGGVETCNVAVGTGIYSNGTDDSSRKDLNVVLLVFGACTGALVIAGVVTLLVLIFKKKKTL